MNTDVEVYTNEALHWTPSLKMPKPLTIMLEIDRGDFTNEDILHQCQTIQDILNKEKIDYLIVEAGYRQLVEGEEDIWYTSFTPQKKLTIDDVPDLQ